jgi:glycerol-3-phosphate dehydrogenase
MSRLHEVASREFDLLVIGGGIIGAGIARDAALRGLSVALLEKADFGGGTTAASSRLVHGGLRYLEMLDFRLVRLDLREREILLRVAPHLVHPLEFLVPFYDTSSLLRWKMRAGMALYDGLSWDKSLPSHRILTRDETTAAEPMLRRAGLRGAAAYFDGHAPMPERICLENALDARASGATILNYTEVTGFEQTGTGRPALRLCDLLEGGEASVRGRVVVNAAGPWLDRVDALLTARATSRIRTTKGIHLVGPPLSTRALVLFSPHDGRLFFVLPWAGCSAIGTTDTDFADDPALARASAADVDYLVESASRFVPVDRDSLYYTTAGVRALVMKPGSESSVSRMHRIVDEAQAGLPGLISVLGGKITGYRAIAEEATDLVARKLGATRRCVTRESPLPGARPCDAPPAGVVSDDTLEHLRSLYGTRAERVVELVRLEPALGAPLAPSYPDIAAQVRFAAGEESCGRLADFLLRRTRLGFTPDRGLQAAPAAAGELARALGWSPAHAAREVDLYRRRVALPLDQERGPPVPG